MTSELLELGLSLELGIGLGLGLKFTAVVFTLPHFLPATTQKP